jgi:predicted nucleic acid-binding protein
VSAVFADTSFYVALANPRDRHHGAAVRLAHRTRGPLLTTEYVLVELGNWLSKSGDRDSFLTLIEQINADPAVTVVPAGAALFARGVDLFRRRFDKEWSMTDCISFAVMQEHGIREALTADRHFEQAGFTALLRESE